MAVNDTNDCGRVLSKSDPDGNLVQLRDKPAATDLRSTFGPDEFRGIMRTLASSVVVIATDQGDRVQAMTATAFTPVSADPPLVLFCIHRTSDTHSVLQVGSNVGISFLSEAQSDVSQRFATKKKNLDNTASAAFERSPKGAPIIPQGCAALAATITAQHWGGDHSIFVAAITWGESAGAPNPLVYHRGAYVRVQEGRST